MFGRWWNAVSGDLVKRNSPYSDFQSYFVPPGGGLYAAALRKAHCRTFQRIFAKVRHFYTDFLQWNYLQGYVFG